MQSPFGLKGKRILVLGGGLGIGEATVRLIAAHGAAVAVVDRELERAQHVAGEIGGTAKAYCIDVLDDDALVAGIAQIEREFGPLDGMATVIGMAAWGSLIEIDMATWDLDQNRNLRYFFLAAREVARSMMNRKVAGSIVCVGSVNGIRSAPNHGAYGAAKAGVIGFTKALALESASKGITVNAIAPGYINTEMVAAVQPEVLQKVIAAIPAGRLGMAEELAHAVLFLVDDRAAFVNGETLSINGGQYMA